MLTTTVYTVCLHTHTHVYTIFVTTYAQVHITCMCIYKCAYVQKKKYSIFCKIYIYIIQK